MISGRPALVNLSGLVLIVSLAVLSALVPMREPPRESATIGVVLLLLACWLALANHSDEIMRFRVILLFVYSAMGVAGAAVAWMWEGSGRRLLLLLCYCAMGFFPLLIPGVLRFSAALAGRLRRWREPGILEALSLLTIHGPEMLSDIVYSGTYQLTNRTWRSRLDGVLRVQFVPTIATWLTRAMSQLAAGAVVRRFDVSKYEPAIRLSGGEYIGYAMVVGGLLWLLLSA